MKIMNSNCTTIQYLTKAAANETDAAYSVAPYALKIISDIREYEMTAMNVEYLDWIVDALVQQGHEILLSHLQAGIPDCAICEALVMRISLRLAK
jgi:hypothetical protein